MTEARVDINELLKEFPTAPIPFHGAVKLANSFLAGVPVSHLFDANYEPYIHPSENGGVRVEWSTSKGDIVEFEFEASGAIGVVAELIDHTYITVDYPISACSITARTLINCWQLIVGKLEEAHGFAPPKWVTFTPYLEPPDDDYVW